MKWSKIWVQRSGTWLPLLFAVCKPSTIFQSSFAAAFLSLPFSPFYLIHLGAISFVLFAPISCQIEPRRRELTFIPIDFYSLMFQSIMQDCYRDVDFPSNKSFLQYLKLGAFPIFCKKCKKYLTSSGQ